MTPSRLIALHELSVTGRRRIMHRYEDLLIDILLDSGFTIEEALNLVALQARLEDATAREQPWTLPPERVGDLRERGSLN
jgi:hypothetical protein